MKNKFLLFGFLLLIPFVLVFQRLFFPATFVFGDAPYLFPQGFDELVTRPQTWNEWGSVLGGVNNALWLYLINLKYGFVGSFTNTDVAIRVVFYIPAIVLSLITSWYFARLLKLSSRGTVTAVMLYILNTYFLLLVDGGQVGVALAYGIFPLTLITLKKLIDNPSVNKLFVSILIFNIHIHTDIRIAAIALLASILWKLFESINERVKPIPKEFLSLIVLLVVSVFINSYWLYPLISLGSTQLSTGVSSLQLTSLLNSLTIFQPHWPGNEFGKVSPPPFYFVALPAIWIIGQILKPNRKLLPFVLTLLVFAFLAKGTTPPFGEAYELFIEKVPFASLFRDSTKFFIPVILFSGVLIGQTVDDLSKSKNKLLSKFAPVAIYSFLLFLIHPALFGQLNGALSSGRLEKDYQTVAERIQSDEGMYRTSWFNSKPPFAYHSNQNPAIDARYLADKSPIAAINTGSYDRFNFLTSPLADEWLELFNIKYLFFKPDEKLLKDDKQKEEWDSLIARVEKNPEMKKIDWRLGFPVYELTNTKPRVFEKENATLVVGSQDIYDKLLETNPDYDVSDNLFFFAEDGLVDIQSLLNSSPSQLSIFFNDKTELDLQMSLVSWLFPKSPKLSSSWATRGNGDFLRWKYELLINGVETKELDYNRGIHFSTVKGEKIKFDLSSQPGDYTLVVRLLDKDGTAPIKLTFNGKELVNERTTNSDFEWRTYDVQVSSGAIFEAENPGGFHAINTAALIPRYIWENAQRTSKELLAKYKAESLEELKKGDPIETVSFRMESPTKLAVKELKSGWLVFSSSFDRNWEVISNRGYIGSSIPSYSSLNTFYIPETTDVSLEFKGQKFLNSGLMVSFTTLILLILSFIVLKLRKR